MSQRNYSEVRDSVTESKFYLPAGVGPSFDPGRLKGIWARLFNHRV